MKYSLSYRFFFAMDNIWVKLSPSCFTDDEMMLNFT